MISFLGLIAFGLSHVSSHLSNGEYKAPFTPGLSAGFLIGFFGFTIPIVVSIIHTGKWYYLMNLCQSGTGVWLAVKYIKSKHAASIIKSGFLRFL